MALRIHGKWYDTTGFDHPGGPIMLELGYGRDATALFEAHHPFTARDKLERLLKKYETATPGTLLDKREDEPTQFAFEWPKAEVKDPEKTADTAPVSDFAKELTRAARTYLEGEAKRRGVSLLEASKATPRRWAEIAVLSALFLTTLPYFFAGHLWTLLVTPLAYWVMGVNLFHDASHFALSRDWRVNMLGTYTGWYFSSPLEWYHQHVIGHHAYPNIPQKDPDLYHNATMERHTASLRWRPMHAHQHRTLYPIWWIGTYAMNFIKPVQMVMSGYYNRAVAIIRMTSARLWIHFLGRALVWGLCHGWPFLVFPVWKALLFAVIPVGIVSFCFMASSQVNHLTPENVDVWSADYYKHQVLTSHTFGINSKMTFLFTGGLNFQIEHHLFPTINHCHLAALQPQVKRICAQYGVRYHESASLGEALRKYYRHMVEMGTKPAKQD